MTPPDIAALLAETGWLRGLAAQLVGAAQADDLAQDALQRALQRPPRADRPPRGFLAMVLRRRACDLARADRARGERERHAARPERLPSTVDAVLAIERQRELMALVLALDEPQRECVLLRFWSDLPPREIARRLQVPVATVHSRLGRAFARLRERLDERHGRAAWCALLTSGGGAGASGGGGGGGGAALPVLVLGGSLMHAMVKVVLLAGVSIAGALWLWPDRAATPPAPSAAELANAPPPAAADAPAGVATDAGARAAGRTAVAAAPRHDAATEAPAPLLQGRVLDLHGRPLAGVRLGWPQRTDVAAESGADGSFAVAPAPAAATIVARDPRFATVLAGAATIRTDNLATVVVAPRLELAGRVRNSDGAAIAGAEVMVHLPPHLGAELGVPLDFSVPQRFRAVADEQGAFALPDVPSVAGATLAATAGGFVPDLRPLPDGSDLALDLVLARPGPGAGLVTGVVVDRFGARVAGAIVSAGAAVARTDEQGAFGLDVREDALPRLCAVARGHQPAVFAPPVVAGAPQWPERVVLQLGAAPASIAGRVVGVDGRPRAGVRVWIADPLYVGHDQSDVLLAETMLGRSEQERAFWAFAVTDDAGRFELGGLLDRDYELRCIDPATLDLTARTGVPAGARDVELVLAGELLPEVRGRVVARDGTPLEGVLVKAQRPALEVQVPGGTRDEWAHRPPVRTDADGAFVLRDVPAHGVEVFAQGDAILFAGRMLEPDVDPLALTIVADRRMHLQVELAPPHDRADELRVLDPEGRPMLLRVMRGQTSFTNRKAAFVDGRTEVLSLGENATTAVIYRSGVEVARQPVALRAGTVTTVRF